MNRPLLLGHRGARACRSMPENTLPSFDQAMSDGCDGFEFDVRLTADGQTVICHDPKTGDLVIAATSRGEMPSLPSLPEVLERYPKAFLDIELKVAGLESAVMDCMGQVRPKRFVVSSFLPEVLRSVHAADSLLPLGLICETKAQLNRWRELPVGWVIPHYRLASRELVDELRSKRKKILVWTVNSAEAMKRFAAWGVDGIISDDTKLLVATLGES